MEDTAFTDKKSTALEAAKILSSHNGQETIILDLRHLSVWTDFFLVTTATSSTHLRGLMRSILEESRGMQLETYRKPSLSEDDEWCLIDFGWLVVHIMSKGAREFYELEKLWFQAEKLEIDLPS